MHKGGPPNPWLSSAQVTLWGAGGQLLCACPGTLRDTRTSVCPQVIQGQFSTLWILSTTWKAATKLSVTTHGQNCSSSPSSMTSLMSQGTQRVCFFPLPKSLSMTETGIYHRPCPWREQRAHEAALRLLPLSWKRLVQAGLTLSEQLEGRKIVWRREGGEWWWAYEAKSPYIILQVGNKIHLRGHVPWVIYKYNGCTRSRMRFSFQQKQRLLLIICPMGRLRNCPSQIRESAEALKIILNQF